MSVGTSRPERKTTNTQGGPAQTNALDRSQQSISISVHATYEEDSEEKPEYHPRWQYIRSLAWVKPALSLAVLYCLGLGIVLLTFSWLPDLKTLEEHARGEREMGQGSKVAAQLHLALPHSFDEMRAVRRALEMYRLHYGWQLAAFLSAAYLFLQAFMIPGSVAINILAGSLYSFPVALLFVALISTLGASLNFCLARLLLRDVVVNLIPSRVQAFSQEVQRHQAHLLNYMLFLRATPILPGWFISLASPIVGVPFSTFLIATGLGHQPMNLVTIHAGRTLAEVRSMRDLYSPRNVVLMLAIGTVALLPVAIKWLQQRKQQQQQQEGHLYTVEAASGPGNCVSRGS